MGEGGPCVTTVVIPGLAVNTLCFHLGPGLGYWFESGFDSLDGQPEAVATQHPAGPPVLGPFPHGKFNSFGLFFFTTPINNQLVDTAQDLGNFSISTFVFLYSLIKENSSPISPKVSEQMTS